MQRHHCNSEGFATRKRLRNAKNGRKAAIGDRSAALFLVLVLVLDFVLGLCGVVEIEDENEDEDEISCYNIRPRITSVAMLK